MTIISVMVTNRVDPKSTDSVSNKTIDWYQRHRDRKLVIEDQLQQWKRDNAARLLTHDDHVVVPEWSDLREEFQERLVTQGLTMAGDSTARLLFGSIWCLVEGVFVDDDHQRNKTNSSSSEVDSVLLNACRKKQAQWKSQCSSTTAAPRQGCELAAAFSNSTNYTDDDRNGNGNNSSLPYYSGTLEYVAQYHFDHFLGRKGINTTTPNKVIVILIPCLHNLWAPGAGEIFALSNQDDWPYLLDRFYSLLNETFLPGQWFVATPVTLSEKKLKTRLELVNQYLKGTEFDGTKKSIRVRNFYTRQGEHADLLPSPNYSGPIPVYNQSSHGNHKGDDSLFDGVGEQFCELSALQHAPSTLPYSPMFLDIASATSSVDSSRDTDDGMHFKRGPTLRRQVWLILKAMRWSEQHK